MESKQLHGTTDRHTHTQNKAPDLDHRSARLPQVHIPAGRDEKRQRGTLVKFVSGYSTQLFARQYGGTPKPMFDK